VDTLSPLHFCHSSRRRADPPHPHSTTFVQEDIPKSKPAAMARIASGTAALDDTSDALGDIAALMMDPDLNPFEVQQRIQKCRSAVDGSRVIIHGATRTLADRTDGLKGVGSTSAANVVAKRQIAENRRKLVAAGYYSAAPPKAEPLANITNFVDSMEIHGVSVTTGTHRPILKRAATSAVDTRYNTAQKQAKLDMGSAKWSKIAQNTLKKKVRLHTLPRPVLVQ
jgi:hypothetical protein